MMWRGRPRSRPGQWLGSGLVVESAGLGRSRYGSWQGFNPFRFCDIKQLLPLFRKGDSLFLDGLLGRSTTARSYRYE
jgi:hypothetical protein